MLLKMESVSKKYKTLYALKDFDCELTEGIYGLLGPNGSGKSTLMKILVGNLRPTEGNVYLDGVNMTEMGTDYKRLIGYMPQNQEVFPFFTGRRFLNYMAVLKGLDKKEIDDDIEKIAEKVNLTDVLDKKAGGYSGGMKQRLLIAQALLGNPSIVIFDEPTAGLDPKERIHVRNLIAENSKDKIILIATHVVQDIEYIANQIILLKKGELQEKDCPENMLEKLEGKIWEMKVDTSEADYYMKKYMVSNAARHGNKTSIRFYSDEVPEEKAGKMQPNLEDVYLHVFGGV